MKKVMVFGILLVLTSLGWAQKKESKISVVVDGLSCSTPAGPGTFTATAWSFGATNSAEISTGGGGGGAAKPTSVR